MTMFRGVTRRTLLGAAVLVPLAGCSAKNPSTTSSQTSTASEEDRAHLLADLEDKYDARLGVYAANPRTGGMVEYRADERFAFCSTFKTLAVAAVLSQNPLEYLDAVVYYTADDLQSYAPITKQHLDTGMAVGKLCEAARR